MKKSSPPRTRSVKVNPVAVLNALPNAPGPQSILSTLFIIDPRSLAVFRILLAALLLVDLMIRAMDMGGMYTDLGMFPRQVIHERYTTVWNWSFHTAGGSWGFQAFLFSVAAVLALAVLVGFKTRFAVVGSWLMLISLQNRVPPILNAGDDLCRMLLFWAMFLPLERSWSIDALEPRRRLGATPVLSVASGAVLLQMAMMYLQSAFFKSTPDWFRGDVFAGTLAHDFYAKPAGAWLLQFPGLLSAMTLGVFVLEWIGPLLLFSPRCTARLRMAAIAGFAAMHLGIELSLNVGLFSWVSLAGLTLFLPAEFWQLRGLRRMVSPATEFQPSAKAEREQTTVFYGAQAICLFSLLYVIVINLANLLGKSGAPTGPIGSRFLNTACGLGQKWNMFEDTPSNDGWYVARAKLRDGSEVDLLKNGAPVDLNRPKDPAGLYPNHRWRKCFREMAYEDAKGFQVFRLPVSQFLCRRWNNQQPPEKQIAGFELIYNLEQASRNEHGSKVEVTVHKRLLRLTPERL